MNTVSVTDLEGQTKDIAIKPGWSLMEVLRDAGYDEILAMCGGCCSCATCHVHVENSAEYSLPAVEEDEEMLVMDADGYDADKSRLSCQIELSDALAGLQISLVAQD